MIYGANDLRVFCGTGVPVSFAGVSTYPDGYPVKGLFDRPMQSRLGDDGIGGLDLEIPTLRLPFNAFTPMPTNRDEIYVDGDAYTVTDTAAEGDGGFICYNLKAS